MIKTQTRIKVDIKQLKENAEYVSNFLQNIDCRLVVVTKVLDLDDKLFSIIGGFGNQFFETKLRNLEFLKSKRQKATTYASQETRDHSSLIFSSIIELDKYLSKYTREVYLNFDFGDHKSGLVLSEIEQVVQILKLRQKDSVVVMSNIGCLASTKPTKEYFKKFDQVRERLSTMGIRTNRFSYGGSNCLLFSKMFNNKVPKELRIGELLFIGRERIINRSNFTTDSAFLLITKIEQQYRNHLLCDFGYNTLDKTDFISKKIKILSQSSDFSLISTTTFDNEEYLEIPLSYKALSKIFEKRDFNLLY